ncbi:MAG: YXWGXW repeat-containing protein [Pseudomonas sp.]|uniref:YXWGXW repeat-containing protein n=1 Tax=Pseudomonas abieticivorans TaxID=2931382 RepID=UPI0020BF8285|nr:YXWGXW repeat-containing protein [Pseudomonas sp. PIA16]MDE1166692.1 YXWGXW repeat-containing protein [Pseudomonas sp.]
MRLFAKVAKLRLALLIPFALASLASMPSFAQTEVIIQQAPPPMRAEMIPAERPGYAWDRGHWRWEGRGYGWVPGHWQPVMHGARWAPGHWQARGPNWRWVEGHWVR